MKIERRSRYQVTVECTYSRELSVWASDEAEAMAKAEEIVSGWNGVISATAIEAEEE